MNRIERDEDNRALGCERRDPDEKKSCKSHSLAYNDAEFGFERDLYQ
jgi:hypothetical protein